MEQIKVIIGPDGTHSCDIGVSTEEWQEILANPDVTTTNYRDALMAFFNEPEHKSTCKTLSLKHCGNAQDAQKFNSWITSFGKAVAKHLNRFKIIDTDGKETFWLIPMKRGYAKSHDFEWQLRDELVEALRTFLMKRLMEAYANCESFNGYEELYKWKLLANTSGKSELDIVRATRGQNIIDNKRVDGVFMSLLTDKALYLEKCVTNLFDESKPLDSRIADYKTEMRRICPSEWNQCANDERTAAALLTCHEPAKYTFYKDEIYQLICQYFGFDTQKPGHKYVHFLNIINQFAEKYGKDIQALMQEQIKDFDIKPYNLAIQTLFWCMKEQMYYKINKYMKFTWIPYYKEFADKLMLFRNNRKPLLDLIYKHRKSLLAGYLHDQDGEDDLCPDIDPFTTFGIFNRGIKFANRINSTILFKDLLKIEADVPADFEGIPILNNQKSHFFGFRKDREDDDIENLWVLFEKIVNEEDFKAEYNKVIKQYLIKVNITMALFWIRPEDFLAFDSTNRSYLKNKYGINLPDKAPEYDEYMSILNNIRRKMESNEIKEKTFYELSANANNGVSSDIEESSWYDEIVETWKQRKNIVLYGAPGTGKTYDVPELAVRLCDPDFCANDKGRVELMERYNQLRQQKRISFTTFHQSMDYEDWIEGLRPVVNDNNQVTYEIEKGIFKQLCDEAERPIVKDKHIGIADDAVVWKVSLMGTGDNPVRSDCMQNNYIRIGWDDYGPIISDETDWSKHNGEGRQILDAFINRMKEGDIIMSCFSNKTIDAVGVVTGDYEYIETLPNYKRVRRVNWILKGINENIVDMNNGRTMTLGTVYRLNSITLENVKAILEKHKSSTTMEANTQPYVMVIDEMNRGNVSKIFGELITLLESDKRKGRKNAESVLLPYSKNFFQIPDNIYIIATMNTADRSLGSLDYAIRRRFAFIADKPKSLEGNVEGFDVDLFKKVSQLFISNYDEYEDSGWLQSLKLIPADTLSEEYKPEDVWIGHSYFIMTDEDGNDNTSARLLYEIIPLLEEYVRDGVLSSEAQNTIDELYKLATE